MTRRSVMGAVLGLTLAGAAAAVVVRAATPTQRSDADRLVGRMLGVTPLMDDLAELCDTIGGRPSASPACARAEDWAAAKFRAMGVDRVALEPFQLPHSWTSEIAEAACRAPAVFSLRVAAAPYTASTPGDGPLEAPLVDAGAGLAADFAKLGPTASGAIALVHNTEMRTLDDLFAEYMRAPEVIASAKKAGVKAVLWESPYPRGLLARHIFTLDGSIEPLPVAMVEREGAERLARLALEGPVRVGLRLHNRIAPGGNVRNVVAEIRGREKPDEIVLIGAHLDSWELGTGANDNGVNAALVIDVARAFRELDLVPRRTVRFVLFTGEEQGLLGSLDYVRRHAAELSKHRMAIVFDTGSGRTTGFCLNGREELRPLVTSALGSVAGLDAGEHVLDAFDGTDNFDFLLSGVPNLVANQDAAGYLPDYHAESDTLDKVDAREARHNAAIAAALVYGLAERADWPVARQTRAQVQQLIEATKLEPQMRAFGQWEDWTSGRRGLAP